MAKKPGAQQIKKEKRDLHIVPAPARMSRRRFLTYLGTGSVALVAGSSGVLAGCAKSEEEGAANEGSPKEAAQAPADGEELFFEDRKSTRLNSSHANISYAVFCLKKK